MSRRERTTRKKTTSNRRAEKRSEGRRRRNYVHRNAPRFLHSWDKWEEGDWAEGIVVGSEKDKRFKRMNYIIKLEDFDLECEDQNGKPIKVGDNLLLNGCGCLERNMQGVQKGDAVKVVYTGQVEVSSGDWEGELCHTMDVYVAEEGGVPDELDELGAEEEEEEDL
jgi:hypothetical protein